MDLENKPTFSVVAENIVKTYQHGQSGVVKVLSQLDLTIDQGEQVAMPQ